MNTIKKDLIKDKGDSLIEREPFDMMTGNFWSPPSLMAENFWPLSFWARHPFLEDQMGWAPRTDISETEKEIKIKTDLPGVKPEDINIEVDKNVLIINGKSEENKKEEGENWYYTERKAGSFRRSLALPPNADTNSIRADAKNGTLTIKISKSHSETKKKIKVGME